MEEERGEKERVTVSFPGVTPMRKYVFEKHKVE